MSKINYENIIYQLLYANTQEVELEHALGRWQSYVKIGKGSIHVSHDKEDGYKKQVNDYIFNLLTNYTEKELKEMSGMLIKEMTSEAH